ncbi:MAG: cytochrome bc complex cytochrome b subunit [Pseudomonadota bacterium]
MLHTDKILKRLNVWVNDRFPLSEFWRKHVSHYYAPKNFNFWYYFGSFSLLVLLNQIITGIWLAMDYTPTADQAFASVQYIMRDTNYGWLLRFMHSTGASAFFVVVYLHMYRGLIYGSYKAPRELIWLLGMAIYITLLLEAFTGYVLPWGQMSFWGAEVITSFASALPFVGKYLVVWLRGDYSISGVTLHRFFSLHVIAVPLVLLGLVLLHLTALHFVGSNNPDGIDVKHKKDAQGAPKQCIPFHPYYTLKDLAGSIVFLLVFFTIVFYAPTMGGFFLEPDNFVAANALKTPDHIAPVWYMTPFYAILRAVPNKLLGLCAMAAAIAFMFVLPWLDKSPVRSIRYKGNWSKAAIAMFVICFIGLGYVGVMPISTLRSVAAQFFAVGYFAFFIGMPFYTRYEKTLPLPEQLT